MVEWYLDQRKGTDSIISDNLRILEADLAVGQIQHLLDVNPDIHFESARHIITRLNSAQRAELLNVLN